MRTNGCQIVATHVPHECDLLWYIVAGLAIQQIERRVGGVREWNSANRTRVDDARNRAHFVQLGVDISQALVELWVAEQRRFKGQQPLALYSEIRVVQMLEGLEEQDATDQQQYGERGFRHDEYVLEPMAAGAGCAAS